ncbi:glycosyl hydrolase [Sphingosinicella sp. BN140058]|uniref:glycosyl hydrolase n=1 Tax=Sphingosinicella sp. BN140058 TaxID=1892855 RepID=UPI0010112FB6|nr:glycosyl hydrolase [Sphingosinicella sp. BN140058]QAY78116.1 glycoside hydrolase [Sphingosinicella sp. BN140058]
MSNDKRTTAPLGRCRVSATFAALLLSAVAVPLFAQDTRHEDGDPLAAGFADPPMEARPRVWWHWMNGNISKDGIAKDLAWMKRVGIGGVQTFDANLATPQVVEKRLVYMDAGWQDAFRFAAREADALDLELAIAASPGWSETGGPWVAPEDAMKKLVWSETLISGARRFNGRLAPPPSVTGPYQDIAFDDPLAAFEGGKHVDKPVHYQDVAVLAYPVQAVVLAVPSIRAGAGAPIDAAKLSDDSLATSIDLAPGSAGAPSSLVLTYTESQTIRSATIFIHGALPPFGDPAFTPLLEVRDGNGWRKVADLPLSGVATTVSFAPVRADTFRIVLGPFAGEKRAGLGAPVAGVAFPSFLPSVSKDAPVRIGMLKLSSEAKVDRFEAKAGFAIARDYHALGAVSDPEPAVVDADAVIDLTARMKHDGSLDWTPPAGRWRVLRLGASLTGKTNHPAPPEATGLEVDKYDAGAVRRYLETYLGMYRNAAGADLIGARGLRALLTDSTEVGASNWTPKLLAEFQRLRGYDPRPYLPALTGAIVGSRARSDAFLFDFRRTLADLHATGHYRTIAEFAHANGLKVYGEALEDGRPALGDDMAMRRYADVPMAAMWTYGRGESPRPTLLGDMKGASSVAHVYGQNVVAAESLTSALSPWAHAPADLRRVVDLEFAHGINRPIIHTSVHQPVDDKLPGLSLAIFGQYFNRHETWAEMARPWVDYIARSSYLLQQGRNVADIAYFYGEEAPLTALFAQGPPADLPTRYAYDFVNPDVLLNQLSVEGGELVAKSGARYKILYLGGSSRMMTLPVLRRIVALADAGARVVGAAPEGTPALGEDPAEYRTLLNRLRQKQVGADPEAALAGAGVRPDFQANRGQILYVHRRLAEGDLYFVANRGDRAEQVEARFRVAGKAPELWRADTGTAEPLSYRMEDGETIVPLDFAADESFFIVFRHAAAQSARSIPRPTFAPPLALDGPWTIAFQPGRGAPAGTTLAALASLSAQSDPGIRYFSGIATYGKDFALPKGVTPGAPLLLDLGAVGDLAEVRVNGDLVGALWHAPYRLDIGRSVRKGTNRLEVRVANLWANRLIGDAQPGVRKITFTTLPTYQADAPLRPSGLIGPVTLSMESTR